MGYWAAGAAIVGDVMAQQGAAATNATSMDIARANNAFNARQAQINRDFQAEQSNTQMQRRVEDLRAANLNPALAYQQGGAQAMPGSSASAAANPMLQNPKAAYADVGQQVTSALGLRTQEAQIDLMKANANKSNVEAGTEIPATVAKIQSETQLNNLDAQKIQRNITMLDIMLDTSGSVDTRSMFGSQAAADTALKGLAVNMSKMDNTVLQGTMQMLMKARNDVNFAASINASNIAKASDTAWGQFMAYLNMSKPVVTTAAGIAGTAADLVP